MASIDANGRSHHAALTSVLSPAPARLPVTSSPATTASGSSSSSNDSKIIEYKFSHPDPQPSNQYSRLIASQEIATVDHFELENGDVLTEVQVAYKTWGKLNDRKDNCMVICHALTGSADVEDWWGPMMGRGLAFDPSRYFIVCCNVLGSPYGSSSPVTINPSTGKRWGPEFPLATVRDDVRLHRIVLDYLGVKSVAVVIGGSMGGMQVLEWALCYPPPYVRNIIPMATSAHHSAWGISWGEAQRQSIYSDPNYEEGYYTDEDPPKYGLGAARMAALLTYRSRDSFESRFGRKEQQRRVPSPTTVLKNGALEAQAADSDNSAPSTPAEQARHAHNDGYRPRRTGSTASVSTLPSSSAPLPSKAIPDLPSESSKSTSLTGASRKPLIYSAQSYLRYQGDKFVSRFDANCYIAITRKMDSHDVCRDRPAPSDRPDWHPLNEAPSHALVLAISSDALFTLGEQKELAHNLPDASLVVIESPEGHDGFLLEFEQINEYILGHLKERLPEVYTPAALLDDSESEETVGDKLKEKKESLFGEAEADVAAW